MDVRCSHCGTEFEFERDRVPADGLSVKCSQCGHVFKVFRDDQAGPIWRVRQANGNLFEFRELTTLQRWIVERKVGREDQISKTGRNWKRLGDIAELAAFFQVVDQAARPSPRPTPLPMPMPEMPQVGGTWSLNDLDTPAPQSFSPVGPVEGGPAPARRPSSGGVRPAMPRPQTGGFAYHDTDPDVRDLGGRDPDGRDPGGRGEHETELDIYGRRKGGGAAKWVIMAVVALLLGAGGTVYVLRPDLVDQLLGGGVPQLAQSHVRTAWTELDRDSGAGIEEAIANFEKAVALAPSYPAAKAGLAEAHLARAEAAVTEAGMVAAKLAGAGADVDALQKQVQALRSAADKDAERAFQIGKEALVLAPDALETNRAMASYYRVKKAPEQMEPLLDRAKAKDPTDARLAYIIGAGLVDDPEAGERAARYLDTALEAAPNLQAARFKLALLYARQKDAAKAVLHLEALLAAVPLHERAKALLATVKPESAPPAPPQPPAAAPEPAKKPDAAGDGMSVEKLIMKADRLRRGDQARAALPLYEQALEQEPEELDALTGLAWCHFDLERYDQAISSFKRVLAIAPRFTDAHMGLANAYEEKNMKRDAVKHYQAYLDILPDGPESAVARAAIQRLQ